MQSWIKSIQMERLIKRKKQMTIKNKVGKQDDKENHLKSLLVKAGYYSPRLLAISTPNDLSRNLKCDLTTSENVIKWAINKVANSPTFRSAEEIYHSRNEQPKLGTGSKAFNNILGGGMETGVMTEFFGHSGSGKTQICYNLCINVQQPVTLGGLEGRASYIDTENKFSSKRIVEIATERNLDSERVLKNIILATPVNSLDQEASLEKIASILEKENKIKLVILDSIINHYRLEFKGRESLSERQAKLEKCVRLLSNIAQLYNVAVVITNQVNSEPDSFTQKQIALGGNVLAHASKHRIEMRTIGKNFCAKIFSSSSLPLWDTSFSITKSGIADSLNYQ